MQDPFLRRMALAYAAIWSLAAIAPVDRSDWLLENLLVFVFVPALGFTHRRFAFSHGAYALIFVFLVMHALGAHYTYSLTPLGFWLQDAFGLARNHYDRVVHLGFGLLLTPPLQELVVRGLGAQGASRYVLPVMLALSLSGGYEILEWWAARIVDPDLGVAFVGSQGDEWDSQKDMSLALCGALLSMSLRAAFSRRRDQSAPPRGGAPRPSPAKRLPLRSEAARRLHG
jgi:putative membrane protein